MTANYLVCNIEGTNKREINEIKTAFLFLYLSESNLERGSKLRISERKTKFI